MAPLHRSSSMEGTRNELSIAKKTKDRPRRSNRTRVQLLEKISRPQQTSLTATLERRRMRCSTTINFTIWMMAGSVMMSVASMTMA